MAGNLRKGMVSASSDELKVKKQSRRKNSYKDIQWYFKCVGCGCMFLRSPGFVCPKCNAKNCERVVNTEQALQSKDK